MKSRVNKSRISNESLMRVAKSRDIKLSKKAIDELYSLADETHDLEDLSKFLFKVKEAYRFGRRH